VCLIGFSTKANCLRHIQKQHPEVESIRVESQMQIKMELLDAQTRMRVEGTGRDESRMIDEARKSDESRGRTVKRRLESPGRATAAMVIDANDFLPMMLTMDALTSPQRPAHSHVSLLQHVSIKQEYMDVDQPLDFSTKSNNYGCSLNLSGWERGGGARGMGGARSLEILDQPLDLTVKPRDGGGVKPTLHRESDLGRLWDNSPPPSKIAKSSAESFSIHCASPLNLLAKRQILLSPPPPLTGAAPPSDEAEPLCGGVEYSRYYNPILGRLKCPDCPIQFKDGVKVFWVLSLFIYS